MFVAFIIFLALPLIVLVLSLAVAMVLGLVVALASHDVIEVSKKPIVARITSQGIGSIVTIDRDTPLKEKRAIKPRANAGTADVVLTLLEGPGRVPFCRDGLKGIGVTVMVLSISTPKAAPLNHVKGCHINAVRSG